MRIARKLALIALTVILIITGAVPAFADTQVKDQGVCGRFDSLTWTFYDDGTLVINGNGDMDDYINLNIPWEKYKESIKSVKIEEGVTSIKRRAFEGCKNMTQITIPEGVKTICECALSGCSSLKEIKLPQSLLVIGNSAFDNCTGLTEIRIPDNVRYADPNIFSGCRSLRKILIPDSASTYYQKFFIIEEGDDEVPGGAEIEASVYKSERNDSYSFDLDIKGGISVTNQTDGIKISWKNAPEADSYIVWRQKFSNGRYGEKRDIGWVDYKDASYTDKSARSGVTYRYYVLPYKEFEYAFEASDYYAGPKTEKVVCRRLAQPEKVSVKAQSGSRISWSRVKGAAGYQIYRKASDDSEYRKIATVKGYTYTDRNISRGKTYEYKVRAYYKNSSGRYFYSPYSESVKYRIRA